MTAEVAMAICQDEKAVVEKNMVMKKLNSWFPLLPDFSEQGN